MKHWTRLAGSSRARCRPLARALALRLLWGTRILRSDGMRDGRASTGADAAQSQRRRGTELGDGGGTEGALAAVMTLCCFTRARKPAAACSRGRVTCCCTPARPVRGGSHAGGRWSRAAVSRRRQGCCCCCTAATLRGPAQPCNCVLPHAHTRPGRASTVSTVCPVRCASAMVSRTARRAGFIIALLVADPTAVPEVAACLALLHPPTRNVPFWRAVSICATHSPCPRPVRALLPHPRRRFRCTPASLRRPRPCDDARRRRLRCARPGPAFGRRRARTPGQPHLESSLTLEFVPTEQTAFRGPRAATLADTRPRGHLQPAPPPIRQPLRGAVAFQESPVHSGRPGHIRLVDIVPCVQ
jgi:hypothetical protein